MAQQIMFKVQNESLRAYMRGKRSFKLFGVTFTIRHAHDNEYQVLLPDLCEIFRLQDCGSGDVRLYVV